MTVLKGEPSSVLLGTLKTLHVPCLNVFLTTINQVLDSCQEKNRIRFYNFATFSKNMFSFCHYGLLCAEWAQMQFFPF